MATVVKNQESFITDEKTQHKLRVKAFLLQKDVFEQELLKVMEGHRLNLEALVTKQVDDKKMAELNYRIGELQGLTKAKYIIDQFADELLEDRK